MSWASLLDGFEVVWDFMIHLWFLLKKKTRKTLKFFRLPNISNLVTSLVSIQNLNHERIKKVLFTVRACQTESTFVVANFKYSVLQNIFLISTKSADQRMLAMRWIYVKIQLQISPLKFTVDWRINVMLGMSTTFLSIHHRVESKKWYHIM